MFSTDQSSRYTIDYSRLLLPGILCFLVLLGSTGCQPSRPERSFAESPYFRLVDQYTVPDDSVGATLFGFVPHDFAVAGEWMYLQPAWTRQIVRTRPPFRFYEQVGRNGLGPREYATPASLVPDHNQLFYSDRANMLIKSLPLDTTAQAGYYAATTHTSESKFAVHFPYVAVLNNRLPMVSLFRLQADGNSKLVKEFLPLESRYEIPARYGLGGGGIHFDAEGHLYCIPDAPYVLYKFAIKDQGEDVQVQPLGQYDLTQADWYLSWTEQKYRHYSSLKGTVDCLTYLGGAYTKVEDLALIQHQRSTAVLVQLVQYDVADSGDTDTRYIMQCVSSNGQVLDTYCENLRLLGAANDRVYFFHFKTEKKPATIDVYQFLGYN